MPAAYAHMTMINVLSRQLEKLQGFPPRIMSDVLRNLKFCELGAISPDYPYLALSDRAEAQKWADAMHYTRTLETIRVGVRHLQRLKEADHRKALVWLLGYTAHVAMDVSIHPVVELKVGKYEGNEKAHRICEMNQDVHIFHKEMNLEIALADYLRSHIGSCHTQTDRDLLDETIEAFWRSILKEVYPEEFEANPPDIHAWHRGFNFAIDRIAEEGGNLVPIARHVTADLGLTYPLLDEIDRQYIDDLKVPSGELLQYDQIFADAVKNIADT